MHTDRFARGPSVSLVAAASLGAYTALVRPRLLTWGASSDEVARAYPGDELVPDADGSSTMATTLPAPPGEVWPWLLQMGCNRAGWYSWDRLDNGGRPSADRIVGDWQRLVVGQRLDAVPSGDAWFTVAVLEPQKTLVLRSSVVLPFGRPFDPSSGTVPGAYVDSIWGFHLAPAAEDMTRLVVRTRSRSRPRLLTRPLDVLFWEPAHLVMQTRQFHNLLTRVSARA
ncbi:hypothetical protein GCM10009730_61510 [Streptomyces albidochromogenes]|uniref:hypothetical protein n=1 Tax=Streptomyces albidochromogenes TaxID=329524 RepID=UPI00110F8599|nr:hypothetical protein [Streptomyces albidochromogenes]